MTISAAMMAAQASGGLAPRQVHQGQANPEPQRGGAAAQRFGQMLADQVNRTNSVAQSADATVVRMVDSQGANLHETMIALEKADLSTRLTLKIGQKLVQAYQEVQRMQV